MPAHFAAVKRAFHRVVHAAVGPARAAGGRPSPTTPGATSSIACSVSTPTASCSSPRASPCRPADRRTADVGRHGAAALRARRPSALPVPGHHLSPQEPPDAARRVRLGRRRDHPDAALVLTGGAAQMEADVLAERPPPSGCADRVLRLGRIPERRPRRAVRTGRRADVPVALRGLRHPGARGDGRGLPGRGRRRHRAARGGRRRRPSRRPARRARLGPRHEPPARRRRTPPAAGSTEVSSEPRQFDWPVGRRSTRRRSTATSWSEVQVRMKLTVDLPALRARRRAHRRGDDAHRPRAGRPRPPPPRRHLAPVVPASRHRAGLGGKPRPPRATPWGRITRVHPFPTDKRNIPARALAFGGFTVARHAGRGHVAEPGPTRCWPCRRR